MSRTWIIGAAFTVGISAAVVLRPPHTDSDSSLNSLGASSPSPSGRRSSGPSLLAPVRTSAPEYASLVPDDSFLLLQFDSINNVDALIHSIQPEYSNLSKMMLQAMLAEFQADFASLDPNKPIAVAVGPGEPGRGSSAAILPVPAPSLFAKALRLKPEYAEPVIRPSYIGISDRADYAASSGHARILENLPEATFLMRVRPLDMGSQIDTALNEAMAKSGVQQGSLRQVLGEVRSFTSSVELFEFSLSPYGGMQKIVAGCRVTPRSPFHVESPDASVGPPTERAHELFAYVDPSGVLSTHVSWDSAAVLALLERTLPDDEEARATMRKLAEWLPLLGQELVVNIDVDDGQPAVSIYARPGDERQEEVFRTLSLGLPLLLASAGVKLDRSEVLHLEGGRALRLGTKPAPAPKQDASGWSWRREAEATEPAEPRVLELAVRSGHLMIAFDTDLDRMARLREALGLALNYETERPDWIEETSSRGIEIATYGDGNGLQLAVLDMGMHRGGTSDRRLIDRVRRATRGKRIPVYMRFEGSGLEWRFEYRIDVQKLMANQSEIDLAVSGR